MVEGGVDLVEGDVDGVPVCGGAAGGRLGCKSGQWTKETGAELHQQHPELEAQRSESVASARAHAFDQPLGAELGQIVAQLAEAVVTIPELMAAEDAAVQLAGGWSSREQRPRDAAAPPADGSPDHHGSSDREYVVAR